MGKAKKKSKKPAKKAARKPAKGRARPMLKVVPPGSVAASDDAFESMGSRAEQEDPFEEEEEEQKPEPEREEDRELE